MNRSGRDDSVKNRLASFLNEEGDLKIIAIKIVKYPIFKVIASTSEVFIVKGYKQFPIFKKQWDFFSEINKSFITSFIPFPNKKHFLKGFGYYWTLQTYIDGKKLDYQKENDRIAAWQTLREFHTCTSGIQICSDIKKMNLMEKWLKRLGKWRQTKNIFEKIGKLSLYYELEKVMLERMELYQLENVQKIEDNILLNWNHGDVASHNFLRDNSNNVYMIDFDLLAPAPALFDYIQLCQRFLPYIEHQLDQLYTYIQATSLQERRLLLIAITVPTDLIREWWYYSSRPHTLLEIEGYLEQFSMSWQERKQFVAQVDVVLK